jgi:hypothetical protein
MSNRGIIAVEPPQACELCGELKECRPYGPNGKQICFNCGMKDKEGTEKKMAEYLFGENNEST